VPHRFIAEFTGIRETCEAWPSPKFGDFGYVTRIRAEALVANKGLSGVNGKPESTAADIPLTRGIGVWQATALNITMIVGAGVFITIPLMLKELPGPYALLGWLAGGALILVDGLVWSELGAMLPGSGGTYQYLLEGYGPKRWGRLAAFLFIWQFLLSGPLELGSGLVAIATFAPALHPELRDFDKDHEVKLAFAEWKDADGKDQKLGVTFSPSRFFAFCLGVVIVLLLYGKITTLGKLMIGLWIGVLAAIAWVLIEGAIHFHWSIAFALPGAQDTLPDGFAGKLGAVMILALYSYLGYYNICYIGDEVRNPGHTIPRSIVLSALAVVVLFAGVHLALVGTVPWAEITEKAADDNFNLPAAFMGRVHEAWAPAAITVLLIWCCFGSAFAGMLGYSRIPYGAARNGHFFPVFARVHPRKRIPHLSLLFIGGLTVFWSFFDLDFVINALITTRILEQFVAQIGAVILLRRNHPARYRPYRMPFYPLPCLLALGGWLYVYGAAGWLYIAIGLATLAAGIVAFFVWACYTRTWPFATESEVPITSKNRQLEA
jgi:amino acid transporter